MTAPLSVLVIEDEPLIAMMLEDFIDMLGHRLAGTSDSVAEALVKVAAGGFDVAILDVNLRDGRMLAGRRCAQAAAGKPFVLATGGHVEPPPAAHAKRASISKAVHARRRSSRAGNNHAKIAARKMRKVLLLF